MIFFSIIKRVQNEVKEVEAAKEPVKDETEMDDTEVAEGDEEATIDKTIGKQDTPSEQINVKQEERQTDEKVDDGMKAGDVIKEELIEIDETELVDEIDEEGNF